MTLAEAITLATEMEAFAQSQAHRRKGRTGAKEVRVVEEPLRRFTKQGEGGEWRPALADCPLAGPVPRVPQVRAFPPRLSPREGEGRCFPGPTTGGADSCAAPVSS